MTEAHYNVAFELARERSKQIHKKGWSAEHDDSHSKGEMAIAAACYAWASPKEHLMPGPPSNTTLQWPWLSIWWKPNSRRRALVKAGALIIAEIERLDRLKIK